MTLHFHKSKESSSCRAPHVSDLTQPNEEFLISRELKNISGHIAAFLSLDIKSIHHIAASVA